MKSFACANDEIAGDEICRCAANEIESAFSARRRFHPFGFHCAAGAISPAGRRMKLKRLAEASLFSTPGAIRAESLRRRIDTLSAKKCAPHKRSTSSQMNTPGAIRTHDLQSRSLTLYPAELRAHLPEHSYYTRFSRFLQPLFSNFFAAFPPYRKEAPTAWQISPIRCLPLI